MENAYVINGVVVSDDGSTVRYHTRCPHCGDVNTTTTYSCHCSGVTNNGSVTCSKCYKHFEIQLRRGR